LFETERRFINAFQKSDYIDVKKIIYRWEGKKISWWYTSVRFNWTSIRRNV